MNHNFSALSSSQFEYLSSDLIGRDIGVRFEQFGAGPDGGMDGRHARGPDLMILQAKNYDGSGFSGLMSEMRKSRATIDSSIPSRYILSTAVSMSPDLAAWLVIGDRAVIDCIQETFQK